jgi:hypothetical protein
MPPFDSLTTEEVWDLVHFVQSLRVTAHEAELVAVGLQEQNRKTARDRIWAAMSGGALGERTVSVETERAVPVGLTQQKP